MAYFGVDAAMLHENILHEVSIQKNNMAQRR